MRSHASASNAHLVLRISPWATNNLQWRFVSRTMARIGINVSVSASWTPGYYGYVAYEYQYSYTVSLGLTVRELVRTPYCTGDAGRGVGGG